MSDTSQFSNTSKVRRPDTVTFDYQTCFTLGPATMGDSSQGIISHVWRIRNDGQQQKIFICRENDNRDGWQSETELFSYSGDPIDEIDSAFDQSGRVFVCAERAGHVWLYYFNPTIPGFEFADFGVGRTPRCILDNPRDPSDSDIILFYMDDENDVLAYRQQRDRYQISYTNTGVTDVADKYVEDATRTKTNRVQVYYSQRNETTGRYALKVLLTTLYPYTSDPDNVSAGHQFEDGGTLIVVIIDTATDPEHETAEHEFLPGGLLFEPLILHTLYDKDTMAAAHEFLAGGELFQPLIDHTLYDKDADSADHEFRSGSTLVLVVIQHVLFDKDTISANHAFRSGGTLT